MAAICDKIPNCEMYEKDIMYSGERCKYKLCTSAPAYSTRWGTKKVERSSKDAPTRASLDYKKRIIGKKDDSLKLRFDLIPPIFLKAVATILSFGARKYGPNNWQTLDNFEERYTGALMRHLNAWRSGERTDPESGHSHLWHIACNVAFLIWKEYNDSIVENSLDTEEFMRNNYRL